MAWVWLDERIALAIHERSLTLHGGATGLRDAELLQSAIARPLQAESYRENPDVAALAAAYTAGTVRNHPFVDGNKRTGFVIGILFLELNGMRFTAAEEAAAQAVFELAAGVMSEDAYAAFLRENSETEPG